MAYYMVSDWPAARLGSPQGPPSPSGGLSEPQQEQVAPSWHPREGPPQLLSNTLGHVGAILGFKSNHMTFESRGHVFKMTLA